MKYPLNGTWECTLPDGSRYKAVLPGTLDENKIGHADTIFRPSHPEESAGTSAENKPSSVIRTRLTRRFTFEGAAVFTRTFNGNVPEDKRIFLMSERARCLSLSIDGKRVVPYDFATLAAPHVFEVTGLLRRGSRISLISDNHYPGLPREAILNSSAATDETQTNWNGILGDFCLFTRPAAFIRRLTVIPSEDLASLFVRVETDSPADFKGMLHLESDALEKPFSMTLDIPAGKQSLSLPALRVKKDAERWDEYEGNLYEMKASLIPENRTASDEFTARFGIRRIGVNKDHRLTLNGRPFFLRSEANCAVFPETGYEPMDLDTWLSVMKTYKSYGVNLVRFHSHIPPEAAFEAADRCGMMVEPELDDWDPRHALADDVSVSYYTRELLSVLETYGNHPSFVMLTLGNELYTDETGYENMGTLLHLARRTDPSRLYANASNGKREREKPAAFNDFHTAMAFDGEPLRGISPGTPLPGFINNEYPDTRRNYSDLIRRLRQESDQPVFGFEVGQFEVLPDFDEIDCFHGVTDPANYRIIREEASALGLLDKWKNYAEATGEAALLSYRAEVEAVLRTPEMSGLSLLGLQDFPGQGTALVGMMNSHMQPKPYAFSKPENFRSFFTDLAPLALLPARTFTVQDTLRFEVRVANYSRSDVTGTPDITLTLHEGTGSRVVPGKDTQAHCRGKQVNVRTGTLVSAGEFEIPLADFAAPARFDLAVSFAGKRCVWPIWIYEDKPVACPEDVHEFRTFNEEAKAVLERGGTVYLSPASTPEAMPGSVRAQFTPDFWSVGTFPEQTGCMGQYIDTDCPLFEQFPTEFHTNWQWWPMANRQAVIVPQHIRPIVTEMDSCMRLRHMAQIFAGRCLNGRLLFSSVGLQDLQAYPEARALQSAIYRYLSSDSFDTGVTILPEELEKIMSS
ncbi:MAG: glycoside hydrolase family 2 TIM barrel-domain containing protein [Lachnospiraceae bacterium]|nr:glycoside hydrolase family 2 TIM barrel-domain containing protein [Lachnospiraceae bacterium]